MAVLTLKPSTWVNPDGLARWFGRDQAIPTRAGSTRSLHNGDQYTDVIVALAGIAGQGTGNQTIVADTTALPAGAFIKAVEYTVLKETAGASATLDFGLVQLDRTTELDFNGLLAASAAFSDGTDIGESAVLKKGGTGVGALVGTRLTAAGLFTCNAVTANYTDGIVRLGVYWFMPAPADYT